MQPLPITIQPQEYASLRSEIAVYSTQILTVMTWSVSVTIAFLTFAVKVDEAWAPFLALLPLLLLLPGALHLLSARRNIIRIASFMRAFSTKDFHYEIRLLELRGKKNPQKRRIWFSYTLATTLAFAASIILCFVFSAILFKDGNAVVPTWDAADHRKMLVAIGLCVSGVFGYLSYTLRPGGKLDRDYQTAWERDSQPALEKALDEKGANVVAAALKDSETTLQQIRDAAKTGNTSEASTKTEALALLLQQALQTIKAGSSPTNPSQAHVP